MGDYNKVLLNRPWAIAPIDGFQHTPHFIGHIFLIADISLLVK